MTWKFAVLTLKKIPTAIIICAMIFDPGVGIAFAKGPQGVDWKGGKNKEKVEKDKSKGQDERGKDEDRRDHENGLPGNQGQGHAENHDGKEDKGKSEDHGGISEGTNSHNGYKDGYKKGPVISLIRRGVVIFPNFETPATNIKTAGETATLTGSFCLYKLQGGDNGKCQHFKKGSFKVYGSYPAAMTDVTANVNLHYRKERIDFSYTTPALIEQDAPNSFGLLVLSRAMDLTTRRLYHSHFKVEFIIIMIERLLRRLKSETKRQTLIALKNVYQGILNKIDGALDERPEVLSRVAYPIQIANSISGAYHLSSIFDGQRISIQGIGALPFSGENTKYKVSSKNLSSKGIQLHALDEDGTESASDSRTFSFEIYQNNQLLEKQGPKKLALLEEFQKELTTLSVGASFPELKLRLLKVDEDGDETLWGRLVSKTPFSEDSSAPHWAVALPSVDTTLTRVLPAIDASLIEDIGRLDPTSIKVSLTGVETSGTQVNRDLDINTTEIEQWKKAHITRAEETVPDGNYAYHFFAKDNSGNDAIPISLTRNFSVDNTPPSIAINQADNVYTKESSFILSGTVTDLNNVHTKIYQNENLVFETDNKIFEIMLSLVPGQNNIRITSKDEIGNQGEDIILSHIVFDNEAPLIITQAQGNIFTKESTFSLPIRIQDITNVKTEVLLNGIRIGIYEAKDFTPQLRLREGSNSIIIKSKDQLENISEDLVLNNIVLDTIKPKINLANINITQHEKLFTVQASISDANLNLVQLFQNGVKVFEGNVSSINQSISLEAGRNFFTIIARDKSSNESTDATLDNVIFINNPPVARANVTLLADKGSYRLDATASSDSDGSIASVTWDIGILTKNGTVVEHTFPEGNSSSVTLTVTDNYGATHSTSLNIFVPTEDNKPSNLSGVDSTGVGVSASDIQIRPSNIIPPDIIANSFRPISEVIEVTDINHPEGVIYPTGFIKLQFNYDPSQLQQRMSQNFMVFYRDTDFLWKQVHSVSVDSTNHIVYAYTNHLSPFVLTILSDVDAPQVAVEMNAIFPTYQTVFTLTDSNLIDYENLLVSVNNAPQSNETVAIDYILNRITLTLDAFAPFIIDGFNTITLKIPDQDLNWANIGVTFEVNRMSSGTPPQLSFTPEGGTLSTTIPIISISAVGQNALDATLFRATLNDIPIPAEVISLDPLTGQAILTFNQNFSFTEGLPNILSIAWADKFGNMGIMSEAYTLDLAPDFMGPIANFEPGGGPFTVQPTTVKIGFNDPSGIDFSTLQISLNGQVVPSSQITLDAAHDLALVAFDSNLPFPEDYFSMLEVRVSDQKGNMGIGILGIDTKDHRIQILIGQGGALETLAFENGQNHNCTILEGGGMRCWGMPNLGVLGYGTYSDAMLNGIPSFQDDVPLFTAAELDAGEKVTQLVSILYSNCALTNFGHVRCWGYNSYGQLGLGHKNWIGDDEPASAAGYTSLVSADEQAQGVHVKKLSGNEKMFCALLTNGGVRCWGYNEAFVTGDKRPQYDIIGDNEVPSDLPTISLGGPAIDISVSRYSACARIEMPTGEEMRCWGMAYYLGLGGTYQFPYGAIGDYEFPSEVPVYTQVLSPQEKAQERKIKNMVSSHYVNCVHFEDGGVRCWGVNSAGELGYPNNTFGGWNAHPYTFGDVQIFSPAEFQAGRKVELLRMGAYHACAIINDGALRCWGINNYGQLGLGYAGYIGPGYYVHPYSAGDVSIFTPTELAEGRKVVDASLGVGHTCITNDLGQVKCWGDNSAKVLGYGEGPNLGDDELPSSYGYVDMGGPVAIIGGEEVSVLAASFTTTPAYGPVPLTVQFDASGSIVPSGTITEYRWDFGDQSGITFGTPLAPHTYDTVGVYTVTLEIVTSEGLSAQTQRIVNVSETPIAPTAILSATPRGGALPLQVAFNAGESFSPLENIVEYRYNFGDGVEEVSASSVASHIYTMFGIYLASVTAVDSNGITSTSAFLPITLMGLNQPPIADFNCIQVGSTSFSCDANESFDIDGDIINISWTIPALNLASTGTVFNFGIPENEDIIVRLTVTDNQGAKAMKEIKVNVDSSEGDANLPPIAAINCSVNAMNMVNCDSTNSNDPDGEIVTYLWEIPDLGLVFSTPMISFILPNIPPESNFLIRLTVTDNQAASAMADVTCDSASCDGAGSGTGSGSDQFLPPGPLISFRCDVALYTVDCYSDSTHDLDGYVKTIQWDMGNGETLSYNFDTLTGTNQINSYVDGHHLHYIYQAQGQFEISLSATDDDGNTTTGVNLVSIPTQVNIPPMAFFACSVSGMTINCESFSIDVDGYVTSLWWDVGNGDDLRVFLPFPVNEGEGSGGGGGSQFDTIVSGAEIRNADGVVIGSASGASMTYTYATPGIYSITLRPQDELGSYGYYSADFDIGNVNIHPTIASLDCWQSDADHLKLRCWSNFNDSDGYIKKVTYLIDGEVHTTLESNFGEVVFEVTEEKNYNIEVIVEDNAQGISSLSKDYFIEVWPELKFNFACTEDKPQEVQCDVHVTNAVNPVYVWDMGDGTVINTKNHMYYVFASGGAKRIEITYADTLGRDKTRAFTINLNQKPQIIADFNVSATSGTIPLRVTFDSSPTTGRTDTEIIYQWDFGDKNIGLGENVTHTYEIPGTYVARLTTTDKIGNVSQKEVTINALGAVGNLAVNAGGNLQTSVNKKLFTHATITENDFDHVDSISWKIVNGTGHGTIENENNLNPSFIFSQNGIYQVQVTVTSRGISANDIIIVTVSPDLNATYDPNPVADFSIKRESKISDIAELNGALSSDYDNSIESYKWIVNGQLISDSSKVVSVTLSVGDNNIDLEIYDSDGNISQKTQSVTVENLNYTITKNVIAPNAIIIQAKNYEFKLEQYAGNFSGHQISFQRIMPQILVCNAPNLETDGMKSLNLNIDGVEIEEQINYKKLTMADIDANLDFDTPIDDIFNTIKKHYFTTGQDQDEDTYINYTADRVKEFASSEIATFDLSTQKAMKYFLKQHFTQNNILTKASLENINSITYNERKFKNVVRNVVSNLFNFQSYAQDEGYSDIILEQDMINIVADCTEKIRASSWEKNCLQKREIYPSYSLANTPMKIFDDASILIELALAPGELAYSPVKLAMKTLGWKQVEDITVKSMVGTALFRLSDNTIDKYMARVSKCIGMIALPNKSEHPFIEQGGGSGTGDQASTFSIVDDTPIRFQIASMAYGFRHTESDDSHPINSLLHKAVSEVVRYVNETPTAQSDFVFRDEELTNKFDDPDKYAPNGDASNFAKVYKLKYKLNGLEAKVADNSIYVAGYPTSFDSLQPPDFSYHTGNLMLSKKYPYFITPDNSPITAKLSGRSDLTGAEISIDTKIDIRNTLVNTACVTTPRQHFFSPSSPLDMNFNVGFNIPVATKSTVFWNNNYRDITGYDRNIERRIGEIPEGTSRISAIFSVFAPTSAPYGGHIDMYFKDLPLNGDTRFAAKFAYYLNYNGTYPQDDVIPWYRCQIRSASISSTSGNVDASSMTAPVQLKANIQLESGYKINLVTWSIPGVYARDIETGETSNVTLPIGDYILKMSVNTSTNDGSIGQASSMYYKISVDK